MTELRFADWNVFQNICRFWMEYLVKGKTQFQVYGAEGQAQAGVDLVPCDPSVGIVGQSKCWYSKPLDWRSIEAELRRTENYPGKINLYVLLTTAPRHISVQEKLPGDVGTYSRAQGEFQVHIYYWNELESISFIPRAELQRAFPQVYATLVEPAVQASSAVSIERYTSALASARAYLPTVLTSEHIQRLADWDFSLGYVPKDLVDVFQELDMEVDRTKHGMAPGGQQNWLTEGGRLHISKCFPAAVPLFQAIEAFAQAVRRMQIHAVVGEMNVYRPSVEDSHGRKQISLEWGAEAAAVVAAYRQIVQGLPES